MNVRIHLNKIDFSLPHFDHPSKDEDVQLIIYLDDLKTAKKVMNQILTDQTLAEDILKGRMDGHFD